MMSAHFSRMRISDLFLTSGKQTPCRRICTLTSGTASGSGGGVGGKGVGSGSGGGAGTDDSTTAKPGGRCHPSSSSWSSSCNNSTKGRTSSKMEACATTRAVAAKAAESPPGRPLHPASLRKTSRSCDKRTAAAKRSSAVAASSELAGGPPSGRSRISAAARASASILATKGAGSSIPRMSLKRAGLSQPKASRKRASTPSASSSTSWRSCRSPSTMSFGGGSSANNSLRIFANLVIRGVSSLGSAASARWRARLTVGTKSSIKGCCPSSWAYQRVARPSAAGGP
mmetsp:Transcript_53314/g.114537  ORF Transcript_53314/g.114537 Transcript_53314/m.114537 type:complete len:285 (+) Transcript_53314:287-1141(+)